MTLQGVRERLWPERIPLDENGRSAVRMWEHAQEVTGAALGRNHPLGTELDWAGMRGTCPDPVM
jgi:hypothetical protein